MLFFANVVSTLVTADIIPSFLISQQPARGRKLAGRESTREDNGAAS